MGGLLELLGELGRREGFRDDGATSLETWAAEHCGVSLPTARAWAHVAERLDDLPRLADALSRGEVTFDKVRAVVDSATPETDEELRDTARSSSVRELAALARAAKGSALQNLTRGRNARTLRCNDSHRTITAQFTPENYAEVKTLLVNTAKRIEFDRDTRWDQRLHDALLLLVRNAVGGGSEVAGRGAWGSEPVLRRGTRAAVDSRLRERRHLGSRRRARGRWIPALRRGAPSGVRLDVRRRDRRRRRTHDVRRSSSTMGHSGTTARSHTKGSALSVPGVHQRDLHQRAPRHPVERRRFDGPREPRDAV